MNKTSDRVNFCCRVNMICIRYGPSCFSMPLNLLKGLRDWKSKQTLTALIHTIFSVFATELQNFITSNWPGGAGGQSGGQMSAAQTGFHTLVFGRHISVLWGGGCRSSTATSLFHGHYTRLMEELDSSLWTGISTREKQNRALICLRYLFGAPAGGGGLSRVTAMWNTSWVIFPPPFSPPHRYHPD